MVRFRRRSVTLSNACEVEKVCREHYTLSIAVQINLQAEVEAEA